MTPKFGEFEEPLADRYRFEAELGRGGMGTVYRAMDQRLHRHVAIKLLHTALTNDVGVARFQSEIRIAAGLRHAHIVAVHDSGEAAGHLYYVMDFAEGETLRARIKREKQMSVEDALAIVEEVADGLQYAHDHGVVHRDVKPENIILSNGHACVVDFGLARAFDSVDTDRLTASGLAVGTPHYLSPEQAAAEKDVGPKADQYALACVLYEMLAGEPPFTGPTASSIAMKHIATPPEPLRKLRRTVPAHVEAAVQRAMEKVPADRFVDLLQFSRTLNTAPAITLARRLLSTVWPSSSEGQGGLHQQRAAASGGTWPLGKLRVFRIGLVALFMAVLLLFLDSTQSATQLIDEGVRYMTGRPLDTLRVAVLGFETQDTSSAAIGARQRLIDALGKWKDISVVSSMELDAARQAQSRVSRFDDYRLASAVGAGRRIVGTVSTEDKAVRVRAELRGRDIVARSATILVSATGNGIDSAFAHLAYSLMFASDEAHREEPAAAGTNSVTAFHGFLRGRALMKAWNLLDADSAFAAAVRRDPSFSNALLALAQVRAWARDASPTVGHLASSALSHATALSQRERLHATALADLAAGQYQRACARYESLVHGDSLDGAAWYGLAECSISDQTVVADGRSVSGWRFRSSRERGLRALDRALDLFGEIHACCEARVAQLIRRHFDMRSFTRLRMGRIRETDSTVFLAYPELRGDTLAFTPYPAPTLRGMPPSTRTLAVLNQRRAFLEIASKRLGLAPNSVDILELMAEALELSEDAAAIDTIHRARTLPASASTALRLASVEVWLRIKFALPGNLRELSVARDLADSLLRSTDVLPHDAATLASLAVLVGDAARGAALASRAPAEDFERLTPPSLRASGKALLTYAAFGGPSDSLRELESRVASQIASGVPPPQQAMMRTMWLERAARLAFPHFRGRTSAEIFASSSRLSPEAAYARGEAKQVHALLQQRSRERTGIRPAEITLDAVLPEAWLLAAVGDTARALEQLGATLDAVHSIPISQLADVVIAGTLIQAMSLRADLLRAQRQTEASMRWKNAVAALRRPANQSTASRTSRPMR